MTFVAPIVEGHGEQQAVKQLLGRIAAETGAHSQLTVNEPIRIKSGSFINDSAYFSRYVSLAAAKARQRVHGHVLILLDCEDDCPAQLGPKILKQAQGIALDASIVVALAYREYETWFMAAARSLRGLEGLPADLVTPAQPELTRDAKGWLGIRMPNGYDPISHQLSFTRRFDLTAARANSSFNRLYLKIAQLLDVAT